MLLAEYRLIEEMIRPKVTVGGTQRRLCPRRMSEVLPEPRGHFIQYSAVS